VIKKLKEFEIVMRDYIYYENRRNVYFAFAKFIESEYKSSLMLIQNTSEIEKDKSGWNITIRILTILNHIELENYNLAESLVENLRKHIERTDKVEPVSKRNLLISQVLFDLMRKSFDFKKTWKSKNKQILNLESGDAELRWQINTPEMIVFEEWFAAKLVGRNYDHVNVMAKMKKKFKEQDRYREREMISAVAEQ